MGEDFHDLFKDFLSSGKVMNTKRVEKIENWKQYHRDEVFIYQNKSKEWFPHCQWYRVLFHSI